MSHVLDTNSFVDHLRREPASNVTARLLAHLAATGSPIGPNDLMIAAIALANQMTLVTHNTAEFSRVPGLTLEDWQ